VRENIVLALQAQRGWLRPIRDASKMIAERFIRQLGIRTPAPNSRSNFSPAAISRRCCSPAGC
jgi:simple sugar transport system ATP-binding protein